MLKGKLFISHLDYNISAYDLQEFLEDYSYMQVNSCKILKDPDTGRSIGCAYVDISLDYPQGHERSEFLHEVEHLNRSRILGSDVHVKVWHFEENVQHLWDTNHFSNGRNRGYYRDYNHFREDYNTSFRHHY